MSIYSAMTKAYSLEDAFKESDCTSAAMKAAIEEWFKLYYESPTTKEGDPCQRIAYTVVDKLTRACFGEYQASSKDSFAQSVLNALNAKRGKAMQTTLTGGEAFIKPVPGPDGFIFSVVRRDNMLVFGRDADGNPTDVGLTESFKQGRHYYTLLERRSVDGNGYLTIRNMLYRSMNDYDLGQRVQLQSIGRYEALQDEYTFPTPMHNLGMAHLRVPVENVVDGSADGVAVFAAAVGLIHNINANEAQINGEFRRGESKVFASADLMARGPDGKRRFTDDVFVGLDEAPEELGITIFSPNLRIQQYHERKREYLRNVESVMGIKRGLLSEVEAQERTAKEITSSEGDYNLTIISLQGVWSKAVRDIVKLCGILGPLYKLPGAHEIAEDTVVVDWGNGVLYDEEKTWKDYLDMAARGLIKPEIAVGWRFGMPTDTPEDLQAIREKYMPELNGMLEDGDA